MRDRVNVFYVSLDTAEAQRYAARFDGAGVFTSIEEALASANIDAVDNCLPSNLHPAVTEAALNAGKHVLVEKPMALSLEDAWRMIDASRKASRMLMVAENFRFLPHLERAKALITEGTLGEIFLVEVNHFERLHPRGWRTQGTGEIGGALIDVGHHFVDMAVQLGGPVRWVFAQFSQKTIPEFSGEDTAVMMLGFESGVIGQLAESPPQPTFIVCGTKASLYFDWQSGLWLGKGRAFEPSELVMSKDPEPPDSFAYWGASIHRCVEAFVDTVETGRESQVPGEVGAHDLAIILAAHQSARNGMKVAVEDCPIATRE
jgi:myo-inositol 2-dehydrogenase / D-chiro-inositol 1-dehydrogenase